MRDSITVIKDFSNIAKFLTHFWLNVAHLCLLMNFSRHFIGLSRLLFLPMWSKRCQPSLRIRSIMLSTMPTRYLMRLSGVIIRLRRSCLQLCMKSKSFILTCYASKLLYALTTPYSSISYTRRIPSLTSSGEFFSYKSLTSRSRTC